MDSEYGKVPPQAENLEESILGSLMMFNELYVNIVDIIKAECFYKEANKIIYTAIVELEKKDSPFNEVLVCQYLKETEQLDLVGGVYYISCLPNYSYGIEESAQIIKDLWLKREMIRISSELISKSYNDSECVYDIISDAIKQIEEINKINTSNVKHISECIKDVMKVIDSNYKGELSGIPTGFIDYDRHSHGDQKGDLIIYAGETSQGKTALALCKAFNQAMLGYKVAFFSYEMSTNQITARLMSLATEVASKKILMDKLDAEDFESINTKINKLIESNIYIPDIERSDYDWLQSKIKSVVSKYNIDSVIIDYIQLINIPGLPKNQQIGNIANGLKFLAKHKNINLPITCLSQLKRDEHHPKPELWRLKESGDIENAADTVCGIWRPEFYNIQEIGIRKGGVEESVNTNGIGIMHTLKGRNIGLIDIILNWNPELTRYSDYTENEAPF